MDRIDILKDKMLQQERYASIEQALIITKTYRENGEKPIIIVRALALKNALEQLDIGIEAEELIVGNRTKGVRYGVVFPEGGGSWISKEFKTLATRPQDKFNIHEEDIEIYEREIAPYFKGKSLEDVVKSRYGTEIRCSCYIGECG